MNLFGFVWLFIAIILFLQGVRSYKEGIKNNRPFIYGAIALVSAILNFIIK